MFYEMPISLDSNMILGFFVHGIATGGREMAFFSFTKDMRICSEKRTIARQKLRIESEPTSR
jgi:hypothetical protein